MKKSNTIIILIVFICIFISILGIYHLSKTTFEATAITSSSEEEYEEVTIYSSATPLDSVYEKLDISLSTEEIPEFLDSSSCTKCMGNNLLGSMFNENISNEYKIMYIINRATSMAFSYDEETMSSNYGYIVSLKKTTIEKLARQIFNDIAIPEKYSNKYNYYTIEDFTCKKENCYYNYVPFKLTNPVITGYETKTYFKNNIATLNYFYIKYNEKIEVNNELGTIKTNIYLYDEYNGQEITKFEDYTFYSESTNIFDTFSSFYESLPTYEYTFNEKNVLISVKKLDN